MKTIATAIVAAAFAFTAAPEAGAREYRDSTPRSVIYISGRASCGTPIYTEKYFVRYNRHGNPMWGYRQLPLHYHGSRGGGYHRERDYGHRDDYRGGYRRDHDRGGRRLPSPADIHRRHVDAVRGIFR